LHRRWNREDEVKVKVKVKVKDKVEAKDESSGAERSPAKREAWR
jgi:hypothetical protein